MASTRPYVDRDTNQSWWKADKGEAHERVFDYVRQVERAQFALYDRFKRLESLYDTNPRTNSLTDPEQMERVNENLVASSIDTVAGNVSTVDVRARVETTDADWSQQRTAKRLEWYCDGLASMFGVGEMCRYGFKLGGALKGTGANYVYIDQFDEIRAVPVMPDDIVVDELESHNGMPRQLHLRLFIDRDDLKAQFPGKSQEIDDAQLNPNGTPWMKWAGYRPIKPNELVAIWSWRLPVGPKGHKRYVPGRETLTIDGCDLLDAEYDEPDFPIAKMVWERSARGWFGIGLIERIAGHQRALNKRNWHIERVLDRAAQPTTWVQMADAKLAVQSVDRIGNVGVYKASAPITVPEPQVNPEVYKSTQDIRDNAREQTGISRMAMNATKPAGVDSAVGLREYRDQSSQRFAVQAKNFERFWLDTILLLLRCCKKLAAQKKPTPVVDRKARFGSKRIKWADVDLGDLKIQLAAAGTISQTPAGRAQAVVEWSQAGVISTDEARRLMDHPDLERAMSIYTAALEDIEFTIEEILEGETPVPEPYQNLKMGVWRMQQEYLIVRVLKAPEPILESLRDWIVIAADRVATMADPNAAPANENAMQPASAVAANTYAPMAS